jgi:hypothetical protein
VRPALIGIASQRPQALSNPQGGSAEKQIDEKDEENDSQEARGSISPLPRIWIPRAGECKDDENNEKDQNHWNHFPLCPAGFRNPNHGLSIGQWRRKRRIKSRMRGRTVINHPNFNHPRSTIFCGFNDRAFDSIKNLEIVESLGRALESSPMEEIIPSIISRYETKSLFELSNLSAHQRENLVLVVFEGC